MMQFLKPRPAVAWLLPYLLGGLLLLVTAAAFGPVMQYDFVAWDDDQHVYENPRFQPTTWTQVGKFWRAPYAGLYMPLTYTTWAMLTWLSRTFFVAGMTASLCHSLNLLLHLGSTLVVYRIGLLLWSHPPELCANRSPWAAAVGAFIFALHPLQVEAVAWVSGLKDVLCGWWAVVALWQYLAYVKAPQGSQRIFYYVIATGAFGLSLLAKPAAVIVPLLAWLLATSGLGQHRRQATSALAGWTVLALVWGVWSKWQQPDAAMNFIVPLWNRPIIVADALAFYLGKLLWPVSLGPDYGRSPLRVLHQGWWLLTGSVPILMGFGVWWKRRSLPGIILGATLFTAALLPVSGLIPFFFQGYSTVADRYVYLAVIGPALAVGWAVRRAQSVKLLLVTTGLLLALLGWRSTQQVGIWHDTMALFTHALQVNPRSALAHGKLGTVFAQQERYIEAMAHYAQALQLNPHYATVYNNLGLVLFQQGQPAEAIAHYTKALQLKPDFIAAYSNLGFALADQGRLEEAIAQYHQALQLDPAAAEVHYNLGNVLRRQGQLEQALTHYMQAVQLKPAWAEAHNNLGSSLDDAGRLSEAITHYEQALTYQPDFAEAHNNLGDALMKQHRAAEAMRHFHAALQLRPAWAEAYYNLGVAAIHQGQRQEALAAYRAALRLRPGWVQASLPLVWLLLAPTPPAQSEVTEAVVLAEQTCKATHYSDAAALFTLAMAYQATGVVVGAHTTATQALALATATGQRELVTQIAARFPEIAQRTPSDVLP
jgi:tetratricopeptide (TPR) repeat protein